MQLSRTFLSICYRKYIYVSVAVNVLYTRARINAIREQTSYSLSHFLRSSASSKLLIRIDQERRLSVSPCLFFSHEKGDDHPTDSSGDFIERTLKLFLMNKKINKLHLKTKRPRLEGDLDQKGDGAGRGGVFQRGTFANIIPWVA